jgi:hypothetical protein
MHNTGETAPSAEQMNNADARMMMLGIAENYEKLARRAEQRAQKPAATAGERAARKIDQPAFPLRSGAVERASAFANCAACDAGIRGSGSVRNAVTDVM